MKTAAMNVDYVDHMGTDLSVVNAARVSFDKESEWGIKTTEVPEDMKACLVASGRWKDDLKHHSQILSDKDAKLINYLAKHNHWSPFAHTSIQLRVKAPIFVARQLVKHQVGGVWNEVSRRYVDSEPEFWFPDQWRGRPAGSMKQGSSGVVKPTPFTALVLDDGENCELWPERTVLFSLMQYNDLLEQGVAPEQARMILPQNTMTEWYWTGSLMFFTRVCKQRLDPHAQQETREIAERIAEIVAPLFPVSWSALMESDG